MTNPERRERADDIEDFFYGIDGDQHTCYRGDFTNLQECCCGFGFTQEEAKEDLLRQERGE